MFIALAAVLTITQQVHGYIFEKCKLEFKDSVVAQRKANFYTPLIMNIGRKERVNPRLIAGLIWHESNFHPHEVSKAGALGLTQIMPFWFKPKALQQLGLNTAHTNWRDPKTNILVGVRILKTYLEQFNGDVHRALTAYCWGPGNVISRGMYHSSYSNAILRYQYGIR